MVLGAIEAQGTFTQSTGIAISAKLKSCCSLSVAGLPERDSVTADVSHNTASSIFLRTASGFACQCWLALLSLVCFPVFIRILGMEAFGLIGFYYTLQTILRVLDLGLTPTVIRELARSSHDSKQASSLLEKAGTFETFFGIVGGLLALCLAALAPLIATHWLQHQTLSAATVTNCLAILAVFCGVNWVSAFYQSALLGMERQVEFYALRVVEASLSSLGGLALIVYVAPDVRLLFIWQLVIATMAMLFYRARFRRFLPAPIPLINLRVDLLWQIRGFAAGMGAISLLGLILANMDKVFLSRMLPLEQFGSYSLAAFAVSTVYGVIVTPISNVMFPRLSSVAVSGDMLVRDLYHLTIQAFAVIVVPLMFGLILFGRDLFEFWTHSISVADAAAGPVSWLAAGYTLNALMTGPYLLQIAHGWTSLGAKIAALLVVLFLPTLIVLTHHFGPTGAAANFALMNGFYLAIGLWLTHVRYLNGQWRSVVMADIAPSILFCLVAAMMVSRSPISGLPLLMRLVSGGIVVTATMVASALATSPLRGRILNRITSWVHIH